MKKIKILHLSTAHPPLDARIFYKECKSLFKFEYDVHLIANGSTEMMCDNIKMHPLPKAKNRLIRFIISPLRAIRLIFLTNPSIVHFHDPELIPVGILLKILGKKVIYDVHEDLPRQILHKNWIPKIVRLPLAVCIDKMEKFSSRFFDGIITATPHIERLFKPYNKNSQTINNYPLLEEGLEIRDWNKKEKNTICYIGCITRERGIVDLVKAIEKTDIKLYLAGEFESEKLKEELHRLGGWKNVIYLGHLSREECSVILSKSQLGVLLFYPIENHLNAMPNKLFEYMNAGIPILASDFSYWRDFFKKINCIDFVNPYDISSVREKLLFLLKNPEKLFSMGKNGKKAILNKHNWDVEAIKLKKFYDEVLCAPLEK